MQSRNNEFPFSPNFNFSSDNLLVTKGNKTSFIPPALNKFMLMNGTDFLLMNGTNFLLL